MSETDYQEKAADELKKKVELAIESGKLKEIALKACVGSGKEVIASLAVKKLMKAEKTPLFFVWLVVGGDFRAQNAKKEVEDLLGDDAQTAEYGSDIRDSIVRAAFPGTVAFSSFESFAKEETSSPLSGIKAMTGAPLTVNIAGGKGIEMPEDSVLALRFGGKKGYELFLPGAIDSAKLREVD